MSSAKQRCERALLEELTRLEDRRAAIVTELNRLLTADDGEIEAPITEQLELPFDRPSARGP